MGYKLNVLGPPFDMVNAGANTSLTTNIPQYDADPALPATQSAWVLKTGGGSSVTGGGTLYGILGLSTYLISAGASSGGAVLSYQFSYRTLEGTTKRAIIS